MDVTWYGICLVCCSRGDVSVLILSALVQGVQGCRQLSLTEVVQFASSVSACCLRWISRRVYVISSRSAYTISRLQVLGIQYMPRLHKSTIPFRTFVESSLLHSRAADCAVHCGHRLVGA